MSRFMICCVSATLVAPLSPVSFADTDIIDNRAQTTARPGPAAPTGSGRRGGGWDANGTSIDGTRGEIRLDGAGPRR